MKVVVVGAGYAGTIAANRLARRARDVQITVVNDRSDFVERVRLHQHVTGTGSATTPLTAMLAAGITMCVGRVDKIGDGTLTLDDGASLDFDHLVLAVGSTVDPLEGTVPIGTWEGAERARAALAELRSGAVVTVIGGGLTGTEMVSEVAEARPDLQVRLVADALVPSLSPAGRRRVREALGRMGAQVIVGTATAVAAEGVRLESGAVVESDLALWAVAATASTLPARSGLAVTDDGRAAVDSLLRSVTDPRIFVVGDCAAVPGARMACATAMPQGAHAADTLARMISGRPARPYSMGYVGQCVSLGRHDGVLQMVHRDDAPRRTYVSGRTAAAIKEIVCRYAHRGARTASYTWLPGAR